MGSSRRSRLRGRRVETAAVVALLLAAVASTWLWWAASADPDPAPASATPTVSTPPAGAPDPPGADAARGIVFRDDFDRAELGDWWGSYSGQPGGDPDSRWQPEQVSLRNGSLVLRADERDGRWITGGVSNASVARTYGRWDVRFRADAADEITVHFLLWPLSEQWPPEIDFFESFGGDRTAASAFLHWSDPGEPNSHHQLERRLTGVDFTHWHTVGLEWRAGRIDFLVDDRVWSSITGDDVPDEPMWLGLQAQAGGCAKSARYGHPFCPAVGTPAGTEVEIDWVQVRQ